MRILNIDLSKIPANKIRKVNMKDGTVHMFVDVVVYDKETDKYGNDVTAWVSQSKEERERKDKCVYIANGKKYGSETVAETENPFAAQTIDEPASTPAPTTNNDALF